jgi:ribosomal protein L27
VNQSPGAHGAWLNCNKQLALAQPVVAQRGTRLTKGVNLGVGRGVRVRDITIPSACNHASFMHDHSPNRDFSSIQRTLSGA